MKFATVLTLGLMLTASQAFADTGAPLAPGKPAGVHKAQFLEGSNGIMLVAGAALIGITVGLATASNGVSASGTAGGGSGTSTSTGTTTP
ncbi:MAG TPA: hypothetical protein VHZ32_19120 [Rhizomicrobium sp.]|jgi:hypothetical protein|nr:hypothetical protein [Rhizomicrobium sp.]